MEEKYISVNRAFLVLKEKCEQNLIDFATTESIAGFIDKQPTANVQEVMRSEWVHEGKPIHCKNCGFEPKYSLDSYNGFSNSNFCPNCGAKMRSE